MSGLLESLQRWYAARCDGSWEHQRGVRIETLDNPGWAVEVDVVGTPMDGRPFMAQSEERSDRDWVRCHLDDGVFRGYGGPENLEEILSIFAAWVADVD